MLKHTEQEMTLLRREVHLMWQLVAAQLDKARRAFFTNDVTLAREVLTQEKRVDVYDLKIDSDCENYIALYNPVAIDLRLTLSLLKIGRILERIGDFAAGIALHVVEDDCTPHPEGLLKSLEIAQMFDVVEQMFRDSQSTLEEEDTSLASRVIARDEEINSLYRNAPRILAESIQAQPDYAYCAMKLLLLIRKLERIGDHCSNIVEEIVFYIDARVLKHRGAPTIDPQQALASSQNEEKAEPTA